MTTQFINDKRRIAILTVFCMIFALIPVSAFATQAPDISNHWAKDKIQSWVDKGLVNGYKDGTFKPDNNISRAEFISLVNNAFGYTETSSISYIDVKTNVWYAEAIAKAKTAGYISGYPNNTMRPENPITRAEAASIIMKINKLEEANSVGANKFSDVSSLGWSKNAVVAASAVNIMNGYPDGSFRPQNFIKRGEAVVALDKALNYKNNNVTYDKAGTYGSATEAVEVDSNVTVTEKGIKLQNMIIKGNLIIGKSVGDGEVILDKVTVKGETMIYGGGENSIIVIDSTLGKVTVSKKDGKIRIVITGNTTVKEVLVNSGVKLEESNLTEKSFGFQDVVLEADKDDTVILVGTFSKVDVKSEGLKVDITKGTTVDNLILDKKTLITGTGTVKTAQVRVSGITFEISPLKVNVDKGVTAPTVKVLQSPAGGGGGGGASSASNEPSPTEIAIKVNFNTFCDIYIEPIAIIKANSTIVPPTLPTRSGAVFDGWYKEPECINKWNFKADTVTTNITLYAKWTAQLKYTLIDNDSAYAVSSGIYKPVGEIEIPSIYNGKPVKKIENYGFRDCEDLTSITIPNSMDDTGYGAFWNCMNLQNVTISDGVKYIPDLSFYGCTSISNLILPNSITRIGNVSFSHCTSLSGINLSQNVTSIEDRPFSECTNLKYITIDSENPNYLSENGVLFNKEKTKLIWYPANKPGESYEIPEGISKLGDSAFDGCNNLITITIPKSLTGIDGLNNFKSLREILVNEDNPYYVSENGVLFNKNKTELAKYPEAKTGEYVIPESVMTLGDGCFSNSKYFESIIIPDTVTNIGSGVFYGCKNLVEISLSKNLKLIGSGAFSNCTALKTIEIPGGVTSIEEGAFGACTNLNKIEIPDSVTYIGAAIFEDCINLQDIKIGKGITEILPETFSSCTSLSDINIPANVKQIGFPAFRDCEKLENINIEPNNNFLSSENGVLFNKVKDRLILYPCAKKEQNYVVPSTVTSIDEFAFQRCKNLESVNLPNNIEKIGRSAFQGCISLKNITIPSSVEEINSAVFFNCDSLTSITLERGIEQGITLLDERALSGCNNLTYIYVPNESIEAYKNAPVWSQYADNIKAKV